MPCAQSCDRNWRRLRSSHITTLRRILVIRETRKRPTPAVEIFDAVENVATGVRQG